MRQIRPCKILRKFVVNAYEIELPEDIVISLIFNVADLYPYKLNDIERTYGEEEIQWKQQMPITQKPHIEKILDHRIAKNTKRKIYYEYLVKWKEDPTEDASWITEDDIQKH